MIDFDVGVILPAAGTGERIGLKEPKQYCPIMGKPLFIYALEGFSNISWIKDIALVVDNIERAQHLLDIHELNSKKIHLVLGDKTRHKSIYNGIKKLKKTENELKIMVVHDAVRPLVPKSHLEQLVLFADKNGASGSIRPLVSTVIKPDENLFIEQSLDRSQYMASETPQAFNFELLQRAYSKCEQEDLDGTECLQLVLKHTGVKAKLLEGPDDLWKVTYKKDLYSASGMIKEKSNKVAIIAPENTNTIKMIIETLSSKVNKIEHILNTSESSTTQDVYNNFILFHLNEIDQDNELLNFASMMNMDKEGLIIHIILQSNLEGSKNFSMFHLYQNGCTLVKQYSKLLKGVVIIHCFTQDEDKRLADLISNLILSDMNTYSGQTFFI